MLEIVRTFQAIWIDYQINNLEQYTFFNSTRAVKPHHNPSTTAKLFFSSLSHASSLDKKKHLVRWKDSLFSRENRNVQTFSFLFLQRSTTDLFVLYGETSNPVSGSNRCAAIRLIVLLTGKFMLIHSTLAVTAISSLEWAIALAFPLSLSLRFPLLGYR